MEAVLQTSNVPSEIAEGNFDITIDAPSDDAHDQLVVIPEGNVSQMYPISVALTEQYLSQMQG